MHPVLQLLADRVRGGSRPGRRDDGRKLGLAIQGGGMRGVVSSGMDTGLAAADLLGCFDAVYGSSAGAINGAFLVAGQAGLGMTIYYENINNRAFIDPARFFLGKPVVSVDFLLDHVMVEEKPLDWRRVLDSPVRLTAVASSLSGAGAVGLDSFRSREDLFEALRASARIPLYAGPPVSIGDDRYLDALLFESFPFESAIRDGCSHVLVLLTVPLDFRVGGPGPLDRFLVAPYLRRMSRGLDRIYLARHEKYASDLARLAEISTSGDGPPFVLALAPPGGSGTIGTVEKRKRVLVRGAETGMEAVRRLVAEMERPA